MKKKFKTSSPEKAIVQSPEMKQLEEIFRLMTAYGVGEVELENKAGRLHARMPGMSPSIGYAPSAPVAAPVAPSPAVALSSLGEVSGNKPALAANQKTIPSPFVGTFYRSSNPNSAPYVKEGQSVKKGDTLCIIEAMKLMNEIESDFTGKIVRVLVENGQPVEFGEPLFVIEV